MSYKYDPQNGYRNADQIGADEEELNKDVLDIIKPIKKLSPSDIRTAINVISCKEKRQEINQDKGNEILEEQANENRKNITMTTNKKIEVEKDRA